MRLSIRACTRGAGIPKIVITHAGAQATMASGSPEDAALEEKHGVIQPMTVSMEK